MLAKELRIPRERTLFVLAVVFSSIIWLLLTISLFGIGVVFIALALLVGHCLLMAHVLGNGVRVGPQQLPELWARIETASRKLGMDKPPEAYVLQSGGLLNAFATKILSRRFIIIYSDLLEACGLDTDELGRPNELDFVIGHEIGHLAAGHVGMRWFLLPSFFVPLLGSAYSRACEYSCDRCGHAVVGDLTVSSRALAILAAGPRAARRMSLDAFVDQRRDTRRFWMAVFELNSTHPFLSKRVAALREQESQGAAEPVGRNPLAYPLAPLFGVASGNPAGAMLLAVVVMVVFAVGARGLVNQLVGPKGSGAPAAGVDPETAAALRALEQANAGAAPAPGAPASAGTAAGAPPDSLPPGERRNKSKRTRNQGVWAPGLRGQPQSQPASSNRPMFDR
jgi:Zn-dependent protease with chaperone function